jgi:pyridoxal phosphate enzyme (YggS family)
MIGQNISGIKQRILDICSKTGRSANEIIFVAVSKNRTAEEIEQVISAGITNIGENKVKEAMLKYEKLADLTDSGQVKWHMIGHLQDNKVKPAVKLFSLIHSVDTLKLAEEINNQAGKINKIQDILIEVNTSGEKSKFGFKPEETIQAVKEISRFACIKIKGLMTLAPEGNKEEARRCFRASKELMEKINSLTNQELTILSMGMTDDFEIAIGEGSTMIRLGRAVFSQA